jgi:hypothetical protein
MSNSLLALVAAAALLTGTPEEGADWLHEAESHLYTWPSPGSAVHFQVKTDVLEKAIEMLRKQLPPDPDPAAVKMIEALRRTEITGAVDTGSGTATAEVEMNVDTSDPARKAAVDKVKEQLTTLVTKMFEVLPFHDPTLLHKDGKVLEASDSGNQITVKISGKNPGEETSIRLERRRMLPESFKSATQSVQARYTEVLPGKFAPARLDIETPGTPRSTLTFTYQRVGDLVFPSTVVVETAGVRARLDFRSIRVDGRAR